MTTRTPSTDNERLARLEGAFEQMNERIADIQTQMRSLRSLFITLLFAGFGIMWASMIGGFIATFVAISNIN